MNAIIKLSVLLGSEVASWVNNKLDAKYKNYTQPPNFYWQIKGFVTGSWDKDLRLKALKKNKSSTLLHPNETTPYEFRRFTENQETANSVLQSSCISVFKGEKFYKSNCRILDILAYGNEMNKKSKKILSAIKSRGK